MPLWVSSVLLCFSLCVILHYLTCPLPSLLTSPVPGVVISVSDYMLCLSSGAASKGQLRHNATQRLSQFEVSSKYSPQMWPSFPSFWRIHCYYPSQP